MKTTKTHNKKVVVNQNYDNLGVLIDGGEHFVADEQGNKLSGAYSTAWQAYDEIKRMRKSFLSQGPSTKGGGKGG